ncbi:outer membrane lipid asymmetry maintenance protein MlaD [Pseudorhodobacter sp. MZDSW-24AT]|uniref:outer membrane lipid asymmetry maintenance protein MlaD n=1 Tax=Pseudorhodobacter sp. MZDSW-24AT TaxID=2052957 RepID=UPI000C1DD995|nr:outer membrane lipid asymmetry maintenance protein MlaD [Pseudorhodobacter sp. MZDSW-24AT]PJF08279.1 outer membrane lipid asymmetry maintenance protein MlaD [Pseudorhodobacter sp. MZDSW-24AT]
MASERAEILAGAAVLAVAVGFLAYAANSAGLMTRVGQTYPLTASFRAMDGISIGSDVRMAGLKVGTISDLRLNPETFFADATIQIRQDILLPEDSAILISSEGLLGGNFVEIVPGGALDTLSPGDEIEDTQGAVSLITLLMKFVSGSDEPEATP